MLNTNKLQIAYTKLAYDTFIHLFHTGDRPTLEPHNS